MTAQPELQELEQKVNLLSKALSLLLFEKKERVSKKEAQEIEERLSKGKRSEFVDLADVLNADSKNTQKGSKRA